ADLRGDRDARSRLPEAAWKITPGPQRGACRAARSAAAALFRRPRDHRQGRDLGRVLTSPWAERPHAAYALSKRARTRPAHWGDAHAPASVDLSRRPALDLPRG